MVSWFIGLVVYGKRIGLIVYWFSGEVVYWL